VNEVIVPQAVDQDKGKRDFCRGRRSKGVRSVSFAEGRQNENGGRGKRTAGESLKRSDEGLRGVRGSYVKEGT